MWSGVGHILSGGLTGHVREPAYPPYIWAEYESLQTARIYGDKVVDPVESHFSFSLLSELFVQTYKEDTRGSAVEAPSVPL